MVQIQITGHGIEITATIRDFTNQKFSRVQKHFSGITSIHAFYSVNKLTQTAEATIHIPGHEVYAKVESEDLYKAIDLLIDKLIRQLDKHKEKNSKNH